MSAEAHGAKYEFRAEIRKLLDIITHSIYTNREIFLRELVSNASDALDKLRFETSRGTAVADPETPLEIRITADKDSKRLTIADTGVGMTRDELVDHLGTIAKSGTEDFLKSVAAEKDSASNLIGRFGVGFYSVFMVADTVTVTSRSFRKDAQPARWVSDGSGSFEVEDVAEATPRGTVIEIALKDEAAEFADPERLKDILRTHSNFISFPILVGEEKTNTIPALWRESKFSVTPEQYKEFYQFLTYDNEEPALTVHISVDAPVQFTALLFIPKRGFALTGFRDHHHGLDLYVRRVLISRETKDLIPEYLGFVRGVVDTEDLPLNISRETLQENLLLRKIQSVVTKQVLDKLAGLAKEDPEKYAELFKEHGAVLKLGYGDYANREAFAELMRFDSSALAPEPAKVTSLADYVTRAREGQKTIYYLSGPSRAALDLNPHLELLRAKGLEVLYCYEPVDEFVLEAIRAYKDFAPKSAEHAEAKELDAFETVAARSEAPELGDEDKSALDGLLGKIKDILGDRITEAVVSTRLTQSPSCLSSPDDHMTSSMQKIMRLVAKDTSIPQKALEINRDHPLIRNLLAIYRADAADPFLARAVEQLYDSALLLDGYLADPHHMVGRINDLLTDASALHVKK